VDRAKSLIGAVLKLKSETYDLLLLDLYLPTRDGQLPTTSGGKDVLAEIVKGQVRRPSHIICLTAYEDAVESVRDEADKTLVHVVLYNESNFAWRDTLTAKAQYVERRLTHAATLPTNYDVDLAIVTSSPLVELQEVKKLPGPFICEHNQLDALDYYLAKWPTKMDRVVSVVACAAPRMGMTAACVTACKAIDRWRPRFLAMTGIAAATTSSLQFGDVLVANMAWDYGSGKILERPNRQRTFIPSPHPLAIDPNLSAILQRWEQEQLRMNNIRNEWPGSDPDSPPRLVVGVLATGAAVVQSRKFVDDIVSASRKIVGLDMESYGIFQAATLARKPRPTVFVAKSISDFADSNKADTWQRYAAFTSARFVYEFFTNAVELYDYPQTQ
jgi:nucleoside phosphorylase